MVLWWWRKAPNRDAQGQQQQQEYRQFQIEVLCCKCVGRPQRQKNQRQAERQIQDRQFPGLSGSYAASTEGKDQERVRTRGNAQCSAPTTAALRHGPAR